MPKIPVPLHLLISIVWIIITKKWGDWKNWKSYYGTILFLDFGDMTYNYVFQHKPLWYHVSPILSTKQIEFLFLYIIYPCILLLMLPYYAKPKSLKNYIIYTLSWIISFSAIELVFYKLGFILYMNGWNYYLSVLFYFLLAPIMILHHFKPLWAILVSALCGLIMAQIFLGTIFIS